VVGEVAVYRGELEVVPERVMDVEVMQSPRPKSQSPKF